MSQAIGNVEDQGAVSRRDSPRTPVELASYVIREDGGIVPITILDISATGVLLMSNGPLSEGQVVALDLPGTEPIGATVQWSGAGIHGCRFVSDLPQSVLSSALLKSGFVNSTSIPPSPGSAEAEEAGRRITRGRMRRQWTQSELGEALGVSKTTVCNWETGKTRPRPEVGRRLQALLLVAEKQEAYRAQGVDCPSAGSSDLAGEVRKCRQIIAEAAGVPPHQVRVEIEF